MFVQVDVFFVFYFFWKGAIEIAAGGEVSVYILITLLDF